jgi:hypothetical protein
VFLPPLDGAARAQQALVTAGEAQLQEALEAHQRDTNHDDSGAQRAPRLPACRKS